MANPGRAWLNRPMIQAITSLTVEVQYNAGRVFCGWMITVSPTLINQDVKNVSYRNFAEESILSKDKRSFPQQF